jgi:hypothetical protein
MFELFHLNRFILDVVNTFVDFKLLFGQLAELGTPVINLVDMDAEGFGNFASRFLRSRYIGKKQLVF